MMGPELVALAIQEVPAVIAALKAAVNAENIDLPAKHCGKEASEDPEPDD